MSEHKQIKGQFKCSCGRWAKSQRGINQHLRNVERERESEGGFAYREHYG